MTASGILRMESKRFRRTLLIGFMLAAVTLILYWPVQSFDFVYDDELYITDNRPVHEGLSVEGLKWSFTTFHAGNWHPLSWISHRADVEAYGLNAGSHHRTSMLIHAAGTVLLFLVLSSMTGALWCSALAAALFAIHPLHVESVAWVAERKDVLSGFFWILTMVAYACYVKHPTIPRYLLVLLSFVLGLLSKPILVTLPFTLLLLDYWPLGRFTGATTAFDRWVSRSAVSGRSATMRVVMEKVPLLIPVIPLCIITVVAQKRAGALISLDRIPVQDRIANAAVSYMEYIWKMLWPVDLAVLYPHAGLPPAWKIVIALLLLVLISSLVVRKAREFPFLLVGWLWYLGTLVPVIGIVQVGSQSMADRYTYIPLVGLFIAISWGVKSIVESQPKWRHAFIVFVLIALSGLFLTARAQVETWKNSLTLFGHALLVTDVNPVAHHNIGAFYLDQNDCQKAVPHFLKAIEMKENYADPYHGLGVCALRETPPADAMKLFTKALEINPLLTRALIDRGAVFMKQGKFDEAADDFRQALRTDPDSEGALTNLGMLSIQQGKPGEAELHLREALRINPHSAQAHNNLGIALFVQGRTVEAVDQFRQAHALAPQDRAIEKNLQHVLSHTAK
jgi:protein O-mannosyl-transferase